MNKFNKFNIYFSDLTRECQAELICAFGEDWVNNLNDYPLCTIVAEDDEDESGDTNAKD